MTEQTFGQDEVAELAHPDQYDLETDEAIAASRLISRHTPRVTVGDDPDWATVICGCGQDYSSDNDEYVLVEWSVHLGIVLDQAELLQRDDEEEL